jgi:circadian clock protein KaiB
MTPPSHELTLFVCGASDLSARAIADTRALCDAHLAGDYELAVVDIYEHSADAISNQVLAAPTLVRNRPLPVRKLVGDLSDTLKALLALELPATGTTPTAIG